MHDDETPTSAGPPSPTPPASRPLPLSSSFGAGDPTISPTSQPIDPWSMPPPDSPGSQNESAGADDADAPVTIGPYRLLSQLGEGGFGVVYLAERREPFVQRVALKILKPGVDSDAVIARFEQERQALAVMDHPNIARVLDGGLTEPGSALGAFRPYFVMELVQGQSITRYCERNKLNLTQRLELFLTVCEAVQHAHMKGLIHRDLKPGNILVGEVSTPNTDGSASDVRPVVKVIDFGIARALAGGLSDKTIFTESGQIIGTPEYMPPEQAAFGDLAPLDIDTRADVYSLGVILYEMLTGSLPFEPAELRRGGIVEIVRIIREVEPPKPSTRVGDVVKAARLATTAAAKASRAAAAAAPEQLATVVASPPPDSDSVARTTLRIKGVEPASLARVLRGDLDWIVMKAIEKSRNRRYESPSSLAADIRRYLRTEPVEAGPPSVGYRLSKFIRRRRLLVASASACLLAIVTGLVVSLYGLREARIQRDAAAAEAASTSAAVQVLRNVFLQVQPNNPHPGMRVRDLFAELVDGIQRRPLGSPAMETTVRLMAGEALVATGDAEAGRAQLARAIDTLTTSKDQGPSASARRIDAVTSLARADVALGRAVDADDLISGLIRAWETAPPSDARGLRRFVLALLVRSESRRARGESRSALEDARKAHTIAAGQLDDPEIVAAALFELSCARTEARVELDEALDAALEARNIRQRLFGPISSPVAESLYAISSCYRELGRHAQSLDALLEAADLFESPKLPREKLYADINTELSTVLRVEKRLDEARTCAENALAVYLRIAPTSLATANAYSALGLLADDRGEHAAAAAQFEKEVGILRPLAESGRVYLARSLTALARARIGLGQFDAALACADEALDIRRKLPACPAWLIASTASTRGVALAGLGGRDAEAERVLTESAQTVVNDATLHPSRRAEIMQRLIDFHKSRGHNDQADAWARRLRAGAASSPPAKSETGH